MRWVIAVGLVALAAAAQKKGKEPKPPEITVVEFKVRRDAGVVAVEGRVKNGSDKPLKGVVLFFEFLEPSGRMIQRKNTQVTENLVEPGEEGEFTAQTTDPVRAVQVRLDAEDKEGRYLRVDKPGPYTID